MSSDATIDRVEQYTFEPIKGYPMLQWRGKRPFTATQYYPAQHKETHGPEVEGWRNKLYWGDNLQVMSCLLKEFRGKVDLIYIDPPFDSKAEYKRHIKARGKAALTDHSAFEEKQYSDIWANDEYLQFMYERLVLLRELLKETGSIYLHCDYRRSHFLKLIMDEIFGLDNFQNEIIWVRTNSHNMRSRGYVRSNDHILYYTRGSSFAFNEIYLPYGDAQLKRYKEDENGKLYTGQDLTFSTVNPDRQFEWRGTKPPANRSWGASLDQLERWWSEGRILIKKDGTPRLDGLKVYLEDAKGNPLTTNWGDIGRVWNTAGERTDYPTQKPEGLLERILSVSSNPGDLVFDCFMGSGTTQAVAMKMGRRFIGADINLGAVQITTKRLLTSAAELRQPQQRLDLDGDTPTPATLYTGFEVYNVNNYDIFRNPVEAKELLLQALEVNRLQAGSLFDGEKDGRMVKVMPVNRIATRQDLNELITGFDYKAFERRQREQPNRPVERISLVCMGHEPDLAAHLQREVSYRLNIEVVDILRDKQDIQFKRDAEAKIVVKGGELIIEKFYPMNLLAKLSLQQENVEDWRELVESVMIDWNYDGAVLQPATIDIPAGDGLVSGRYPIPADAGTIRIKITDLLSESLEQEVRHG